MAEMEKKYWWHVGRIKIIGTYLKKAADGKDSLRVLNVGCGTGGAVEVLEQYGKVDNVDVSDDAIKYMKKSGYKDVKKVDSIKLPYKDNTFDIVGAFDVLEHIDNDTEALKEWNRVLKKDGSLVLTVPAYQWLWTDHDVSLHHYRRYTRKELRRKSTEARLNPVKVSYAIVFSLPLVVMFRFINKFSNRSMDSESSYVALPGFVNKFFSWFLFAEAFMHRYINFIAGTSVIGVLQKRND